MARPAPRRPGWKSSSTGWPRFCARRRYCGSTAPDAVGVHVAGEEDAAEQGRGDAAAAECGAVQQPAAVQHGLLDGIDGGIAAPEPGTADKGRQRLGRNAQMLDREMVVGKDLQQRPEDQRDPCGCAGGCRCAGASRRGRGRHRRGADAPVPGRAGRQRPCARGVSESRSSPVKELQKLPSGRTSSRDLRSGRKGFALHQIEVDGQLQPGRAQRGDGFFQRTVGHDA